jgi:surface polysaccharide O-acyltransferase-like enzyme
MFYNRALTNWVGIKFFQLVRWCPPIFALVCGAGIGLGIFFVMEHPDSQQIRRAIFLKVMGVLAILFYGGLLVMWSVKRWKGTWDAFCARRIEFFESR